ncbi:hypothetical protein K8I85_16910 [bacterium]|nr:hypothetical protein [bacterium]
MKRKEAEALWEDPAHWKGPIYVCPKDPRIAVPKKLRRSGWTLNFGHGAALPTLLLVIVVATAPVFTVVFFSEEPNPLAVLGAGVVGAAAVWALSWRLSQWDIEE